MGATAAALSEQSLLEQAVAAAGGPGPFLTIWQAMPAEDRKRFGYDWRNIARPKQLPPPGDWSTWVVRAGRGFGKTRTGAEFVRQEVEAGRAGRVALIARIASDTRDVMVEGESGILAISPPWFRPKYEPSKRRLTWPNGAVATTFSAEEPDVLRGPQHDLGWLDELAAWALLQESWDNYQLGLRLGASPRTVVTTTPRGLKFLKDLEKDPTTVVTRGSTYENTTNLAPVFLRRILTMYEGTRLGRQEIAAEILDDNPAALWKLKPIDDNRRAAPQLLRVGFAIDPAISAKADSDETGIVAAGVGMCSCKGTPELHGFVLDDVSGIFTPAGWAKVAIALHATIEGDVVVAEVNQGGDLVLANLQANGGGNLPFKAIHATRGKMLRAEPVAALYEQGKVHHVRPFPKLEDQMTQWNPLEDAKSPDRVDALVYILTELMIGPAPAAPYTSPPTPIAPRRRSGITG